MAVVFPVRGWWRPVGPSWAGRAVSGAPGVVGGSRRGGCVGLGAGAGGRAGVGAGAAFVGGGLSGGRGGRRRRGRGGSGVGGAAGGGGPGGGVRAGGVVGGLVGVGRGGVVGGVAGRGGVVAGAVGGGGSGVVGGVGAVGVGGGLAPGRSVGWPGFLACGREVRRGCFGCGRVCRAAVWSGVGCVGVGGGAGRFGAGVRALGGVRVCGGGGRPGRGGRRWRRALALACPSLRRSVPSGLGALPGSSASPASLVPVVRAGGRVVWWAGGGPVGGVAPSPVRRLVGRSLAFVRAVAAGGPGSGLVLVVSGGPPRPFAVSAGGGWPAWPSCGSGSWGAAGAAALLGAPVAVFPFGWLGFAGVSSLPLLPGRPGRWVALSSSVGVWSAGFAWRSV